MKWLLVSYISVFFLFTFIHADMEENDENYCFDQHMDRLRINRNCVTKVLNQTEFKNESSATLLNYSGDIGAIRALTDKYCPIMQAVFQCTRSDQNEDEKCFSFSPILAARAHYKIGIVILNYTCENDGANLLQFLELNGLSTVYMSRAFENCSNLPVSSTFGSKNDTCDPLNKLFDCYALSVEKHTSKTQLVAMANDIRSNMHQAFNCTTPN